MEHIRVEDVRGGEKGKAWSNGYAEGCDTGMDWQGGKIVDNLCKESSRKQRFIGFPDLEMEH